MLKTLFIIPIFILFSCGKTNDELQISHISTDDYQTVCVQFKNCKNLYACSDRNGKKFPIDSNQVVLPVRNSILEGSEEENDSFGYVKEELAMSPYKIFDSNSNEIIGNITFQFIPKMVKNNADPILSVRDCSFNLPTTKDRFRSSRRTSLSREDSEKLRRKITLWNPNALSIICSPTSDILERCSLIIQFIWSSSPIIKYPPAYVNKLSFIERLEGLESKEFSLLCGGIGKLFIEIATVLMPDIKLRHLNGFECDYNTVYENIHVNSHIFTEVFANNRWIYIDPYFQLYLEDRSGRVLGVKEIREIIETKDLDQFVPVCFPANAPPNFLTNGKYDVNKIVHNWGLFKCFKWIHCTEID